MSKTRKDRSDIQVGKLEKKRKLQLGTIRNTDQTDARSDKELGMLQREFGEEAMDEMLKPKANTIDTKATKPDRCLNTLFLLPGKRSPVQ